MAQRNFMGRATGKAGERFLLGTNNYDPRTGQYRNVGAGLLGRAAQMVVGAVGGPLIGAFAGRGISKLVDRYGPDPQFVQPEAIQVPIDWGAPQSAQSAFTAPSPMAAPQAVQNLGLGTQTPGNTWAGYMQGPGSANNFGNTQFGNGMAGIPSAWSPSSVWGQQITAAPGSNLGLGNNVGGFIGGGGSTGGATSSGSGGRSSSMPGIFGGRFASGTPIGYKQSLAVRTQSK